MAQSSIKKLYEFYQTQNKEDVKGLHPDDNTSELVKILSVKNPIARIAKRRQLSFMTTEKDRIIVVRPDDTREDIGAIQYKDILVTVRTVLFEEWGERD